MSIRFRIAVFAAAMTLIPATAQSLLPEVTFDQIAQRSSQIVRGEVIEVRSYWLDNPRSIVTDVVVAPSEVFAGTLTPQSNITVQVPGGTVGTMTQWVEHAPIFREGEDVVLFLSEKGADRYRIRYHELGALRVVDDKVSAHDLGVRSIDELKTRVGTIKPRR